MDSKIDLLLTESTHFLRQAEEQIAKELKTGAPSEPRLLEVLAIRLASIDVDKPLQMKLMLDAARILYLSGKAERGAISWYADPRSPAPRWVTLSGARLGD